mgnify:CR=1 FL=1
MMKIIDSLLHIISHIDHYIQVTENGHPEHFIVGCLIGGFISFFILKRTNNVLTALFFGLGAATFIGIFKEFIDPLIGGSRDKADIIYTVLGGMVGTVIILLIKKKTTKNILKSS